MFFLGYSKNNKSEKTINSTIILKRIESVSKLVTTEGYYSNIYTIEDHYWFNIYPFKKSMIIKVNLKALVGIDLTRIKLTPNEATKKIYVSNIPDVEPIALDPNVEFYDIQEGLFNSFNKDELNNINQMIRDMSEDAILYGDDKPKNGVDSILRNGYSEELNGFFIPLINNARNEAKKQFEIIKMIANLGGWELIFENK
jgi:hypothetical protein